MAWRYIFVVFATAIIMLMAVLVVTFALRSYAPVIANTYEMRLQGEGLLFKTSRGFQPMKAKTVSHRVKRKEKLVDLGGHVRP